MKSDHLKKLLPLLGVAFAVLCATAMAGEVGVADCVTCHETIHREWSRSLHADAWRSPVFKHRQEQAGDSRKSACDCHAPGLSGGPEPAIAIELRSDNRAGGVDCLSCHMDDDRQIWSSGDSLYVPHFTAKAARYATGAFCASCHKWAANSEFDCQGCHMPSAKGGSSSGKHIAAQPRATHSSHRFSGSRDPVFLSGGAELKVAAEGNEFAITVTSLVPAHAFPAVEHHSLVLAVAAEKNGEPGWNSEIELEPGGSVELQAPAAGGAVVELRFYPSTQVWPDSFYVLQRVEK